MECPHFIVSLQFAKIMKSLSMMLRDNISEIFAKANNGMWIRDRRILTSA